MEATGANLIHLNFTDCGFLLPSGCIKAKYLHDEDVENISSMYSFLYPLSDIGVVTQYCEEFYELLSCGEVIGSVKGRNNRSSVILAKWYNNGLDTKSIERRPG